ncbi:MAG: TetR/AcrR family transcriptional regulator [Rhodobacterales bacterium]
MGRTSKYERDVVLKTAMDLFWSRGYRSTSLKDLEQALDMRPGSIYAAFGSKEALFRIALQKYFTIGQDLLAETLRDAPSPIAGLAAYVRILSDKMNGTAPSRACMLVKTLLETSDDDRDLRDFVEAKMRQIETTFADCFREARDAGEIRPDSDPEQLAARLQASIFGLRAYAQRTDATERIEQLAEDIANDVLALAA